MDAAHAPPHGPIWHGATVLVVDDEPDLRQVVRRTLETEGFHVEEARMASPRCNSFKRAPSRSIWF